MKEYKISGNGIKRLSDGAQIPLAPGNRDYQEYVAWFLMGNSPDPEFTPDEIKQHTIAAKKAEISNTDMGYIRVIEDLIDTLVAKGVIALTDLPSTSRIKDAQRKALRAQLAELLAGG
jgi:hypothetical protein